MSNSVNVNEKNEGVQGSGDGRLIVRVVYSARDVAIAASGLIRVEVEGYRLIASIPQVYADVFIMEPAVQSPSTPQDPTSGAQGGPNELPQKGEHNV